jgi:hypothetical protein
VLTTAQGTIAFTTRNAAPNVDIKVTDAKTGVPLRGPDWQAQLYYSKDLSENAAFMPAFPATVFLSDLPVVDGYVQPVLVVLADALPGATVQLQMKAWNTRAGSSYEEASTSPIGIVGESKTFFLSLSVGPLPTYMVTLQPFSVYPVPEPSAAILIAVGGLSLLLLRKQ